MSVIESGEVSIEMVAPPQPLSIFCRQKSRHQIGTATDDERKTSVYHCRNIAMTRRPNRGYTHNFN
jgi:hypothetical protein